MTSERLYSISEIAAAFGTTVPALRYYEQIGLLAATERRARVRYYGKDAIFRLAFIQLWHNDAMMTLDDTAEIMAGPGPTGHWRELVTQRAAGLTATIARLTEATQALDHLLHCPRDNPLECPVTGKQLSTRIDGGLDRACPHAA
jgi:DNA-binding transcriptional MerR regulator